MSIFFWWRKTSLFFKINAVAMAIFVLITIGLNLFYWRLDYFPFYKWNMFIDGPREITDFSIIIDRVDGAEDHRSLYENRKSFMGRDDRQLYFTLEAMGNLWKDRNPDLFLRKEVKLISEIFHDNQVVEYTLVERRIDVIEFMKTRLPVKTEELFKRVCHKKGELFDCGESPPRGD